MVAVTMARELTFVALLIILGVVWGEAQSCNSCGSECTSACGTRHFRTCCFNYLKKRSSPDLQLGPPMDPTSRLELWLARSGYHRQGDFADRPMEVIGEAERRRGHTK